MRTTYLILFFFTGLCLLACSQYSIKKYAIGKPFHFKSKEAFSHYLYMQTGVEASHCFFVDSQHYRQLMQVTNQSPREGILWGFYPGKKEPRLMDSGEYAALYCKQRQQDAIEHFMNSSCVQPALLIDEHLMDTLRVIRLSDNQVLHMQDIEPKQLVILQFATGFGTYYKDLYKRIHKIAESHLHETSIMLLCLDPVFSLP